MRRQRGRKLALGGKRAEDAELVAFRISEYDPWLRPLPHVGVASSQTDKPLHLRHLPAVLGPERVAGLANQARVRFAAAA
jgi:hypothetical protein